MRDYGIEQIFGGDKDCKHEWGNEIIVNKRGQAGVGNTGNHSKVIPGQDTQQNQDSYCQLCGAWKGQLGLEPTPEMYIDHMIEIFHELKRVLKKEGTFWLNIGDTYGGSCQGGGDTGLSKERYRKELLTYIDKPQRKIMPKCLLMIPERLAWSLIQDGWILRNKGIWHKPNPMPSSVKDRFNNTWEYVFMFSKNNKTILWRHKKTREWVHKKPLGIDGEKDRDWEWKVIDGNIKQVSLWDGFTYYFDLDAVREPHIWADKDNRSIDGKKHKSHGKCEKGVYATDGVGYHPNGKNPGDVFEINTQPFPDAHFAVFPPKLIEKPIKAGCPKDGIVLDPFIGSGTTGLMARKLGRNFMGIELNKEYAEMANKRIFGSLFT